MRKVRNRQAGQIKDQGRSGHSDMPADMRADMRVFPLGISPLTRRILAINILTLLIPVGGVLYLNDYREALITAEMAALENQGLVLAAALGAGAVGTDSFGLPVLQRVQAERVMVRIGGSFKGRARLFNLDGDMIADTDLHSGRGTVLRAVLPPPVGVSGWIQSVWEGLITSIENLFMPFYELPLYRETWLQHGDDFDEVEAALYGENAAILRRSGEDKGLILSVAVPVQPYKQVVGALLISRSDTTVKEALHQVRGNILLIFGCALILTILLSLYLARTISYPINRLAESADQLHQNRNQRALIPDFSHRGDEIGALSHSLRAMTAALWERMDAIEGFAADVAHEIKNPLTSLRSAVELIPRIEEPAQYKRLLAVMAQDVGRIDRLVSDISEASRVDAELSRTKRQRIDIGQMMQALAETIQTTRAGGVSLHVHLGKGPHTVMGLPERLGQVWMNIIANAQSFSPPHSQIRIEVTCRQKQKKPRVTVMIDDEGPGIPLESLDRVFERFYTERPDKESFGHHSGLGLSIARQIIEAHGGTISAENRQDGAGNILGARFIIDLPSAPGKPVPAPGRKKKKRSSDKRFLSKVMDKNIGLGSRKKSP